MASRTYLVGLKLALKTIQHYVSKYQVQIETNGGTGLFAVLELILSLVEVALSIMEAASDPQGNFDAPVDVLSSTQINQVNAAVAAFNAAIETGG